MSSMSGPARWLAATLCVGWQAVAAQGLTPLSAGSGATLPSPWQVITLPKIPRHTTYELVDIDGDADQPPASIHSSGRRVLLTAPTGALQKFLATYAASGDAFEPEQVMRRRPPAR